jgi:high-affinity iron transporter
MRTLLIYTDFVNRLIKLFIGALLPVVVTLAFAAGTTPTDVRRVWQILDYLSVDYAGAVRNGSVVSESEFAEMREFARTTRTKIGQLERRPEQPALTQQADALVTAIEAKKDPAAVAHIAKSLGDGLLAAYPIPLAPRTAPDVKLGATVYAANCASCHGVTGKGDGPAAARLDPKPIAFTDAERAKQRSVFALYQIVGQGISGTSMPAFDRLSDADRWAVATYLGQLAHDPQHVRDGEKLWKEDEAVRREVGGLEGFVRQSQAELANKVGPEKAAAAMAFLHAEPEVLSASAEGQKMTVARERLAQSVAAYRAGDAKRATDLALASYLDGVEPFEQALAARDEGLKSKIEVDMGSFRSMLASKAPVDQIDQQADRLTGLFTDAERTLAPSQADTSAVFFGSFTILVREGIEALLVVVGMLAFLRKAQRPELLRYVHVGWTGALGAGALTWAAATYLVSISGANREVTEGLSSLFAAAVLLSVGVWMHQKSAAGKWQAYLHEKMSAALTTRSALFLFGLSFIAVYREVFETILFYAAMWDQGQNSAVLLGLAAGSATLAVISILLLKFSARLPIGKFFQISSWLVAVLAVVLTGKGIAALQEAGWITPHAIAAPRLEVLGIYPSTVGLAAQVIVLLALVAFFMRDSHRARERRDG